MENFEFNRKDISLRWSIDKNKKLTLYIINKDKSEVKTIDELINNKPGHKIIDVNPRTYYKKIQDIEEKYQEIIEKQLFGNKNVLAKLELEKQKEINDLIEPVRKVLKNDRIAMPKEVFLPRPGHYVWVDSNNKTIESDFLFYCEEIDSVLEDEDVVLGKCYLSTYKKFESLEELKAYETKWQNIHDTHENKEVKFGSDLRDVLDL